MLYLNNIELFFAKYIFVLVIYRNKYIISIRLFIEINVCFDLIVIASLPTRSNLSS